MDVLKPNLIWIDDRCYRNFQTDVSKKTIGDDFNEPTTFAPHDYSDQQEESEEDGRIHVQELPNGSYRTSIRIPNTLFRHIIGLKGNTKRRIEDETNTSVIVPKQGSEGDIIIKGGEMRHILSARTRISIIAESCRQKQPFTHFLSIPMTADPIKEQFLELKQGISNKFASLSRGLDESLFQNPSKLHMTIGTLVLLDEVERKTAAEMLQECKEEIILPMLGNKELNVSLSGLEYLNDDPSEVDVLYARFACDHQSDRLQEIAERLAEKFLNSGLMVKQYNRVKLHVTVMNTLFRSENKNNGDDNYLTSYSHLNKPRETFDASLILKEYRNFNFGAIAIHSVHLSQRYTTNSKDYYYIPTETISF